MQKIMVTLWKDTNFANNTTEHVPFGLRDARGREIGAKITRYSCEVVHEEPQLLWSTREDGTPSREAGAWLCWYPQATRDGSSFGALQNRRYFRTEEEREADIQRYLADAKKRAAKASR